MIQLIKGFHDVLPPETEKWAYIIAKARDNLRRFGFREIIIPIMEKTELFRRGIGEVTDIVEKEMYSFIDRSGESLSLRPEATAGILRAVVEHSLLRQDPVLKLFSIGPMFRRERPSKGRYRQFYQINAEILGDDSPFTDADIISVAHSIMTEIGAKSIVIEINSVGCRACRSTYREALRSYLKPHIFRLCPDCQRRYDLNPLRILDCKQEQCRDISREAPLIIDYLDPSCQNHFAEVQEILDVLDIPYRVEPRLVRGLDYYTRTAFEIIHDQLGRSKAVGGGGRYDSLLRELGGDEVSGIGFAIGIERVTLGIEECCSLEHEADVYVAILGDKVRKTGIKLVNALRKSGLCVETRYTPMSLKAQMKLADKLRSRLVVMIGEDELRKGAATVRNMRTKEQVSVKMEELVSYLQGEHS